MVTVPVLAAPVLGATVMSTVPLPGPVPLTMVIHGVAVVGVHGHVDRLVTTEMPVLPPAAGIVPVVVGMVYVQVGGAALYVAVIVTLLAGIVTVVFGELTLATLDVSPVHLSNICPVGGAFAATLTTVPAVYEPLPEPLFTVKV